MGKMLLLFVVGMGFVISMTSLNINRSNSDTFANAVTEYDEIQARLYAESALEIAIKELSLNSNYSGNQSITFNNGYGSITIQNSTSNLPDRASAGLTTVKQINVVGRVNNKSITMKSIIQMPNVTANPPRFLQYAVATGQNLSLNGNVSIHADNSNVNANIHTNSNFQMNGVNSIAGFLTHTGTAHSNPASRLNTNITPNVNPDGLSSHSQTAQIAIPDFNPDDYLAQATTVYNNNVTLSGNRSLGTKDNPQIIYVGGDLTLSGSITGYGVLIVKGNININGNVSITAQDPTGNNLGLYTKGNINMSGNVTVKAQIYAQQNVNFNGNVKVYGSVTTKGVVNFNGNVNVYYRPATTELTTPFWEGEGGNNTAARPEMISCYE